MKLMNITPLTLFLLMCFGCLRSQAQTKQCSIRIGLIADIQYANQEDQGTRYYRNSIQKVDSAVQFLNKNKVDFTFILGDFVDQGTRDIANLNKHLSKLNKPNYRLLGNHDFVNSSNPELLFKELKMPNSYYAFSMKSWRFIFLNTNEVSQYGTLQNSPNRVHWKNLNDSLKQTGRKNALPWNGGIGKKQLHWISNELAQAKKSNQYVIIVTHHPLLPENGYEALNNREIIDLLVSSGIVKLVLSGHNHKGNYVLSKNIPFVTLEGMIETPNENAFGILEIFPHEFRISGKGRLTSRTIQY